MSLVAASHLSTAEVIAAYTTPGGHDLRVTCPLGWCRSCGWWPTAVRSGSLSRPDAQIAGGAGEEFRTGELALQHEPLRHGERLPRTAEHHLAVAVDFQAATIEHQQAVQPARVESPVPHRPGVDMDKA